MKKLIILLLVIIVLSSCSTVKIKQNILPLETISQEENKEILLSGKAVLEKFKSSPIKEENCKYILAPTKENIEKFYNDPKTPIIFKEHRLIQKGEEKSRIKDSKNKDFEIENALILPIYSKDFPPIGSIVLTSNEEVKGIFFANVKEKFSNGEIKVDLIDFHKKENEIILEKNKYIKINGEYKKGEPLIVKSSNRYLSEILLAENDSKFLTVNYAGRVNIRNKYDTIPLQIENDFSEGEDVYVSINGIYLPATISSINHNNHSAELLYQDGNKKTFKEHNLFFITKNLE